MRQPDLTRFKSDIIPHRAGFRHLPLVGRSGALNLTNFPKWDYNQGQNRLSESALYRKGKRKETASGNKRGLKIPAQIQSKFKPRADVADFGVLERPVARVKNGMPAQ